MARVAGRRGVGVPGLAARLVRAVAAGRPGRAGEGGAGRCGSARSGRRGRRGPGRAGAHRARHRCAPGTLRQAYRHRRDHLVPAVQRAGCGLGPGRADHPGRGGRRGVAGDGAEGLVDRSGDRGLRAAAGSHRCQRAQAPRHHLLRAADATAGGRGAPAAADERALLVQRGVPGSGQSPGRLPDRGAGRRLDGRAVDPRARAPSRRVPARPRCRPKKPGRPGGPGGRRSRSGPRPASRTSGTRSGPAGRIWSPAGRSRTAWRATRWCARRSPGWWSWPGRRGGRPSVPPPRARRVGPPGRKAHSASWPAASSPGRRRGYMR